ncbi:Lsr2 family protein [Rhodococcus sp. IEGM 1351]|uniref:histone-like nucleoid-structuring protein Lsr2 n=1 Tax=Rhodococcus sp. IEGM 1351 TaxID=3047089 RepID=UPI0024B83614|nr:Lsr2 family protein [Rhodococcus sp. IEGM 1351]MDI9934673.1 Lsr2 family protein [Rhodococcus sp. IEGM 1351]
MVREAITTYVVKDDFDGKEIADGLSHLVDFSFEGSDYRIELRPENYDKIKSDFQKWLAAATTVKSKRGRPKGATGVKGATGSGRSKEELAQIRKWAQDQGIDVSGRGRIALTVISQYDESHKAKAS